MSKLFSIFAFGVIALIASPPCANAASAAPLRVGLVAPDDSGTSALAPLQAALAKIAGVEGTVIRRDGSAKSSAMLAPLREAEAAIFFRGPGRLGDADLALLREFLRSGKGLVILAGTKEAWPTEPKFEAEVLGAVERGPFAAGAAMTVINLLAHPIFTGINRFDTKQPMPAFEKLSEDAQMIMEGTVGEVTTPLAWVHRRPGGRMCAIVPGEAASLGDPTYQRLVVNALLWAAGRPIPGAQAAVQRTFMPDAYPGAFAVTLPNGPGVCLDPVRGGINYIWDGDFVDLRPRWITKQGESARIFGEIFYREKEWQPLRAGAPGRESELQFRGYTLQDGFPEFHYDVDGRAVHEKLTAAPDGGLRRTFRVEAGTTPLWLNLEPQAAAEVAVRGLERDGNLATFASKQAGEFTIEIRRKPVTAP